jgi:hypothetical protein
VAVPTAYSASSMQAWGYWGLCPDLVWSCMSVVRNRFSCGTLPPSPIRLKDNDGSMALERLRPDSGSTLPCSTNKPLKKPPLYFPRGVADEDTYTVLHPDKSRPLESPPLFSDLALPLGKPFGRCHSMNTILGCGRIVSRLLLGI